MRVNIGLDAPPYGDPEEVEDPDSLTALVNQYHALPADYAPKVVYLTAAYTNQAGGLPGLYGDGGRRRPGGAADL